MYVWIDVFILGIYLSYGVILVCILFLCVQSCEGAYEYVCMYVYMYGFILGAGVYLLDTVMGTCLK